MSVIKPTIEEITELEEKLNTQVYGELFNRFEEDQRFYELDFANDLKLPAQFKGDGIILPSARDFVDVFVDHIDISNARVYVNRKGAFKISDEEAEMMRKFYLGLIHRTNVESDISPWRVAAKHYATHGLAVMKTVWDRDRRPGAPIQKTGESDEEYEIRLDEWRTNYSDSLPIVIQAVNPRCVMPDPSYGGRQFVIEKHKDVVLNIRKRYPAWKSSNNKGNDEEVDLISYWDKDYRCELADGDPLLRGGVVKHTYGFIPYVFIDAGLGNVSYDAKPELRYVGILRYIYDLLISESLNYSLSNILMKRETMKGGYIKGVDAETVKQVKQEYGKYWPVGDKDVEFVDWESKMPPAEAYTHLAVTSDYLAAHAAPKSVRGLPESGVRSAAHQRLMMSEAGARYRYSEDAFRNGTAKVLTNCARLFKNVIPGNMRVWTLTPGDEFGIDIEIDKNKMHEPFNCYVEFAAIAEEDEYRRHDDLERLVKTGIVPPKWARQQMSNVDAKAIGLEEEKEKIMNDPKIQEIINQYAAGKLAQALSARGEAEMAAQGGLQMGAQPGLGVPPTAGIGGMPRQMTPPIPQRAIPGSAEEQQNILRQQRSQIPIAPMQGQGGGGNR
jgi:hypothetical protein